MFKPFDHPDARSIRECTHCAPHLPRSPKPIFRIHPQARIALISQAPGRKAHESGIAWNDQSGDRLRDWLDLDWDAFYHSPLLAIVPMGFCYPGKGNSGDLPPRKECAPLWHKVVWRLMPDISLSVVIGQYAQKAYLNRDCQKNLTETVRHFADYLPKFFPLPHPSPLNTRWLRKNKWFEPEVLPQLRHRVRQEWNALQQL